MIRNSTIRRMVLAAATVAGGGVVLNNGCANFAYSITPCGTVVPTTICTPTDQANLLFPYLEIPDYSSDPSCSIPRGCAGNDVLPPLPGGPGGNSTGTVQPTTGDSSGGGGGGGGGGTGT